MNDDFAHFLDRTAHHPDIVSAVRAGSALLECGIATERRRHSPRRIVEALTGLPEFEEDALYGAFAVRALGRLGGLHGIGVLRRLLDAGTPALQPYVAWSLVGNVTTEVVPALCTLLGADDAFTRFQAQSALLSVRRGSAPAVAAAFNLVTRIPTGPPQGRIAAIECLALGAASAQTLELLRRMSFDKEQVAEVRAAALRALGDLKDSESLMQIAALYESSHDLAIRMAAVEVLGEIGTARTRGLLLDVVEAGFSGRTISDVALRDSAWVSLRRLDRRTRQVHPERKGLAIAQVVMQGAIDADLLRVGEGDGGGLATLLVSLAASLSRHPQVDRVYTVSRALLGGGVPTVYSQLTDPLEDPDSRIVRLAFGPEGPVDARDMWPYTRAIERALGRYFSLHPPLDALHLRFADAGTWAASQWAHRMGVPIYFTLAPDPYVPMQVAQRVGTLSRQTFAVVDAHEHYLFRAHILDWMTRNATGLALLPRPNWREESRTFFDLRRHGREARIIAEGIDLAALDRAAGQIELHPEEITTFFTAARAPGWGSGLAPGRQGKPILLSVGRLHPIKGVPRLVEAWCTNRELLDEFNLVLVGGNLNRPSVQEGQELNRIDALVSTYPEIAGRLLLLGSQPHDRVTRILAAARHGVAGTLAPHCVYVCASAKEEFGLAILEAMAAGLLVVAPDVGGPPTYLEDGKVGFLNRPPDVQTLTDAVLRAAEVRRNDTAREDMIQRQRTLVENRYSIDGMAAELVSLYERHGPHTAAAS
ncbi:MAG: hypothetical protein NVSMB22_22690 [Chloroflexota bacterium]